MESPHRRPGRKGGGMAPESAGHIRGSSRGNDAMWMLFHPARRSAARGASSASARPPDRRQAKAAAQAPANRPRPPRPMLTSCSVRDRRDRRDRLDLDSGSPASR